MSGARGSSYPADQRQVPQLVRLEPPGSGRRGGWRLAAGAIAILLTGVILAGRLGMEPDTAAPDPSPSPTDVAAAPTPTAAPTANPSPGPSPTPRPTIPPAHDPPPDVLRHLDGLPTSYNGEKVYRLGAALARAGDRPVLVGGWYIGPDCLWPGRCVGRLADNPWTEYRSGRAVALAGLVEPGIGPRVLRVVRHDECPVSGDTTDCNAVFTVLEDVWSGDFFTRTAPIEPGALLAALKFAFPEMRAEAFRDLARCPIRWPPQTYRSITGGPRMTVVFPSVADRLAAEEHIRRNWPRPADPGAGQCLDQYIAIGSEPPSDDPRSRGWVAEDNVMLWVPNEPYVQALARAAILDARSDSRLGALPPRTPVTAWQAVAALRAWDPAIELLPQHDHPVWGPGLDGPPELVPDAFALSDPYVRIMLVFTDPAARQTYQADVDPRTVVDLVDGRLTQQSVGRALADNERAAVRWVGLRNILLQVGGPTDFDDDIRATLRRELR